MSEKECRSVEKILYSFDDRRNRCLSARAGKLSLKKLFDTHTVMDKADDRGKALQPEP